ncbi:MAG TPA: hypothetical protein VK607_19830 [Kofleriaceae bacterium]|nr:hypothetical protein [Kofleriaceae bacterium]
MKNTLTLATTLILAGALALGACGKDKKPAAAQPTEPAAGAAEPTKAEPVPPPTDPAKPEPSADKPKGGW